MGECWRVAQPRRLSAPGLLRIGRLLFGLKDLGLVDCGLPSFRSQPKAESSDLGRKAAAAEHAVRVGRRWHQPADATATTLHRRVAPVAAVLRDRLEVMALLLDEHLRLRELLLLLLCDVLNLTLDQELALALRLLLLLEVRLLLCDLRLLLREQLRLMFGELSQQRQSRFTRPLDQKERGSELTRIPYLRLLEQQRLHLLLLPLLERLELLERASGAIIDVAFLLVGNLDENRGASDVVVLVFLVVLRRRGRHHREALGLGRKGLVLRALEPIRPLPNVHGRVPRRRAARLVPDHLTRATS